MSLYFNRTTELDGIIQGIERAVFNSQYGHISGNTTRMKEWTSRINQTHDEVLAMIFNQAGGSLWQFDDSNHTKFPIIKANIVSGQRDYTFTTDEQGNVILDIYRVTVADSSGVYRDVYNADQQTPNNNNSDTTQFIDGQSTSGTPTKADKTANGIFLNPIPNYNYTNGLQVFINREGSYFSTTDTTKRPGIAGLYHEYYVVNPSYNHAVEHNLKNEESLLRRKLILEDGIKKHYGLRDRGVKKQLLANVENTK